MPQNTMELLFKKYYQECPNSKIRYAIFDDTKTQGHIVLSEGIEIIHLKLSQNRDKILFVFSRGDWGEEYFFNTYQEAKKHFDMNADEFEEYSLSITL